MCEKDPPIRCCYCSIKEPLTQRQLKYGPGYSHVLTSLKEAEPEEYNVLFPKPVVGSQTRSSRKNLQKTIGNKNYATEVPKTINKQKLAPIVLPEASKK